MSLIPTNFATYAEAVSFLRKFTQSKKTASVTTILIRSAVSSPAAANILVKAPLRSKAERKAAVIAAAFAIACETD